MIAKGHAWYSESRGAVVGFLRLHDRQQSFLATQLSISKQAVQQLIDELVSEGIVERRSDPQDGRAKLVGLTADGRKALLNANDVKQEIEAQYRKILGARDFNHLTDCLEKLSIASDAKDKDSKSNLK